MMILSYRDDDDDELSTHRFQVKMRNSRGGVFHGETENSRQLNTRQMRQK